MGDLVGVVVDLDPPTHVGPGEVLLTLRHGAPQQVVAPGRKLRRLKGLPGTRHPQGIFLSTQDVPIVIRVEDIRLKGEYPLTSLRVEAVIAINDNDGYAGLIQYVAKRGINFAALLDGEVRHQFDLMVRERLAQWSHDNLYEKGNIRETLNLEGILLLEKLFCIKRVQIVEPTWNSEFVKARDATAAAATAAYEKQLEIDAQPLDLELQRSRDELLEEQASRRGIDILSLENPEFIAQSAQREHERTMQGAQIESDLKVEFIRQLDSIRRSGGSDMVRMALGMIAGMPETGDPSVADAQPAYGPPSASQAALEAVTGDELGGAFSRLRTDQTLARMWKRAGLSGELVGLGVSEDPEGLVVLAVCSDVVSEAQGSQIRDSLQDMVGATTVVVLGGTRTIHEIVSRYLIARVPDLGPAGATFALSLDGGRLVVEVGSESSRVGPMLRQICDSNSGVVGPLASVLPFEQIDVKLASSA